MMILEVTMDEFVGLNGEDLKVHFALLSGCNAHDVDTPMVQKVGDHLHIDCEIEDRHILNADVLDARIIRRQLKVEHVESCIIRHQWSFVA